MLTKSSVLHFWSSRYGVNPIIGGRPVFTRSTGASFVANAGEVSTAIVSTPRFDWATLNLPNALTERRKVLTLELARTNSILFASDFSNAAWTKSNATVTTGIADPAGGTSACTVTATLGGGYVLQNLATGASIVRTGSVWLRRRTGSGVVQVQTPDTGTSTTVSVTSSWQRFSTVGIASINREAAITLATNGDAVDAWLYQIDDGPFATAGIQTTSAPVTRATDSCYWNFPPLPQGMMIYSRHVEQGTAQLSGNTRLWFIGTAANGVPQLTVDAIATFYDAGHHNGTTSVGATLAVAPVVGDTVELLLIVFADGSIQLVQSINGAAVTNTAQSAANAFAANWSDTRLYLNSTGASYVGANKFAELKIVKYADVAGTTAAARMTELQALELGPNADLL